MVSCRLWFSGIEPGLFFAGCDVTGAICCECLVHSDDCMRDEQTLNQFLRNQEEKQLQHLASG